MAIRAYDKFVKTPEKIRGQNIRKRREALRWSQGELSRRTGLSVPAISAIERGGGARTSNIDAIAAALGCTPMDLVTDPDRARTKALEKMAGVAEPAGASRAGPHRFNFHSDDVSLADGLALCDAYRRATPIFRAFAVALLTADLGPLDAFPIARSQLPGLGAILKALERDQLDKPSDT